MTECRELQSIFRHSRRLFKSVPTTRGRIYYNIITRIMQIDVPGRFPWRRSWVSYEYVVPIIRAIRMRRDRHEHYVGTCPVSQRSSRTNDDPNDLMTMVTQHILSALLSVWMIFSSPFKHQSFQMRRCTNPFEYNNSFFIIML